MAAPTMAENDNKNKAAPSSLPMEETETDQAANRLFEACVQADWDNVPNLCDEYANSSKAPSIDWSNDAALSATIDSLLGEENNNHRRNPLLAAVLHVAIDIAAAHKSISLFSDVVAQDVVDAEERTRLQQSSGRGFGGSRSTLDNPLTNADFCPYLQMRKFGEKDDFPVVDDAHRRARRKAIAKLCRTNPLWIILPMVPRNRAKLDTDINFDDDLPRGTTALHVAVRSRNITLTRLLIKHCPKVAEVADGDGCLPLHFAVRTSDETAVLRRAVVTYQRSLSGGADNAPLEAGPNEVHSGINLYYHGKVVFKATQEFSDLARCRVKRLRRKHKLRMMSANVARVKSRRLANSIGGEVSNGINNGNNPLFKSDHKPSSEKEKKCDCNNFSDKAEKNSSNTPSLMNMYDTPSSLVRAMMYLGTVEEDSVELTESEWNIEENRKDAGLEARKATIASEYPIVVDSNRTITHGLARPTRPWKTERHRTDVVKLLTSTHKQGMLYQCDDGGDTPLIVACLTLQGDDADEDDDFDMDEDMDEDPMDNVPNRNAPVPDEIGEDDADADYEMDHPLSSVGDSNPKVELARAERQVNNEDAADEDGSGEENNNEQPPANNGEDDPFEAVFYMLNLDGSNAISIPDDDGDTALHIATRIGASPRLVEQLLNTMPALASTPSEDGSTPLHLACRRACDLAPEGNGGMGAYADPETIALLSEAAGAGALVAADDEGRNPLHVACRYRASPTVLAELANSEGGIDSLLMRNTEGHETPLLVYCRHATDYHALRILVERCPEAAAALGDGRHLPLHRIICTFNLTVNVDCLKLLGDAYPRGLDIPCARGMTPLALLCESYASPLNVDIPKLHDGRTTLERCLSNKIWLMAKYLILNARTNREFEKRNANLPTQRELMLHATIREPSSSNEIVQLATIIHSDEVGKEVVDCNGDTALHLCCRRRQSVPTTDDSSGNKDGEPDVASDDDDSLFQRMNKDVLLKDEPNPQSSSSARRQRKYDPGRHYLPILYHILKCDITAAGRCNNDGKYAFNLLVEKGATWQGGGVDRVLKAYPQALFSYDLSNGLFALAIARTASVSIVDDPNEEQALCIGATFQLLRGKPTALEFASKANMTAESSSNGERRRSKRVRTK